jgi:hypothetical protein
MSGHVPGAAIAMAARPAPARSDRRGRPTPMWGRHTWLGGRRRTGGRRAGENDGAFVDLHGAGLFAIVGAIILLNYLDAWFTIFFLSHGAREMNPLVDRLLGLGPWPFVVAKSAGIGLCVAVLSVTKNFRAARAGLAIVLIGYTLLLLWHVRLLGHVPE